MLLFAFSKKSVAHDSVHSETIFYEKKKCKGFTCVSLFDLRHPRIACLPHPEGEPCIYIILLDGCERSLRFRFRLEFRLRLQAFASLPSCLLFRPFSSRVALAGLRRVFSRARVSESRAADERGDPELEGYLLGRGDKEVLCSSVLEICFAVVLKGPRVAHVDSSRVLRIDD